MAQIIKSFATSTISLFENKLIVEYQTKNFNDEFFLIGLEETIETVSNVPIQTYASSTIDDLDYSIKSSLAFGPENVTFTIDQNDKLYKTVEIALFENSTVLEYQTTKFDDEFVPVNLFGLAQVNSIIYANTITATTAFGTAQFIYNQNILLGDKIEALSIYPIQNYASTTISEVIASLDYSIASSLAFSTSEVEFTVYPNSIGTGVEFGSAFISRNLRTNSIDSTVEFGTLQLNMEIENVPFPSIASTLVIPQPSVKYTIGPLSIATTANFGTAQFIDNIHRVLVFKDGNISKMGDNDAGVIAGQIRVNPASTASNTASFGSADLPSNPQGFLSVNIAGKDYKIPYYNP
jgi:hypothetical protein